MDLLWPQVTLDDLRQSRQALVDALADPIAAQWAFLQRLLASRANTVIGRKLGLANISSLEEFRTAVPITPYDDVRAYVERIKAGEPDILFPGRAYHFTRTTGTTGVPKDIPLSSEYRDDVLAGAGPFFATIEEAYPGGLAHGFGLTGSWREELTAGGIGLGQPTGAARCVFAKLGFFDWAPEAVFEIRDFQLRYYTLLYYALQRDIHIIFVLSPSTLTMLFGKAEEFASALADDLEDGAFRRGPAGIEALHASLGPLPPPNPAAAERMRQMMATQRRFEPNRVWPNLKAISAWKGEGSAHHLDAIKERSPGVAMWPMHTGSSEAALFVPLGQSWNGGLPALRSTFYEFYPEDAEPSDATFVPMTELEVGKTYRVLLTNGRGMFRYPITDVYKVEGYHQGVPILAYSHRVATVSVVGEKLVEAHVVGAMTHAGAFSASLTDYQLAPTRVGPLDAYVLLLEYRDAPPAVAQLQSYLRKFEEGLIQQNWLFGKYRVSALAPTRLAVVPTGTFERMRRERSDGKRNDSQYKDPHLRADAVDLAAFRPLHVVGVDGELPTP